MTMVWHRFAVLAVATLALAAGGLRAEEPKEPGKKHDRLEMLATKLGLDDKQKEELRKIHQEFDKKSDPVEHQIWALHHEEHEAIRKVLTDEQRTKAREAMKEMKEKEFEKLATKLGLSDDQKRKISEIREKYEPKFHELAAMKEKGENVHKQFRELRHEFLDAVRPDLTEEQRAKLPILLREEHHYWRNPEVQREHLKAVLDKLDLSAEQKEKIKKIQDEYEPKIKDEVSQLKKLHHEEHEAMEKVLTAEQRTKWQELRKHHADLKKDDKKE